MHKNKKSMLLSILFLMFFALNTNSAQAADCTNSDLSVESNCIAVGGILNAGKCDWTISTGEICGEITNIGNLIINNNATVSVKAYNSTSGDNPNNTGRLIIQANSVTIGAGASINATGKGYSLGYGDGHGIRYSWQSGSGAGYGGLGGVSYSNSNAGGLNYGIYMSPNELGSGGGDGWNSGLGPTGGSGGGLVKIVANDIIINGSIIVNGANGGGYSNNYYYAEGGGSGGGINLIANNNLTGTGLLSANGGDGWASLGGGAGGGRIAIKSNIIFPDITLSSHGGTGYSSGGAGTIYKKIGTDEYLTIDNNNISYNSPASTINLNGFKIFKELNISNGGHLKVTNGQTIIFQETENIVNGSLWSPASVTVEQGAVLSIPINLTGIKNSNGSIIARDGSTLDMFGVQTMETTTNGSIFFYSGSYIYTFNPILNIVVGNQSTFMYDSSFDNIIINSNTNILVKNGGILTHDYNSVNKNSYIDTTLNKLEIEENGKISATGKGYSLGYGDGHGIRYSWQSGSGAGYGGLGGVSYSNNNAGGLSYGIYMSPNELGSGGGDGSSSGGSTGGSGGGLVKIVANDIIINGSIIVNGANGGGYYNNYYYAEGGGSGGGINLIANNNLTGTGLLSANGGDGWASLGGGAGGGRIAYYYNLDNATVWNKRKKVTITATLLNGISKFPVKITVPYELAMNSDFSDIRFTKSNGNTPLDYWLESKTDNVTADFWVNLDPSPLDTTTMDIYYYYDSVATTSLGDFNSTFTEKLEGNLVASWDFEGTADDTSGNGNNGTLQGQSLYFDGVDDYVNVGSDASLDVGSTDNGLYSTNNFTVSAWVKKGSSTNSYQRVIGRSPYNPTTNFDYLLLFNTGADVNRIYGAVKIGGGEYNTPLSTDPLIDGNWYFVAMTYDDDIDKLNLYIDGIQQGSGGYASGKIDTNGGPTVIGADADGSGVFKGNIDDVRIYSRALGQAELSNQRWNSVFVNPDPDLVGFWQMKEGSGQVVADDSGMGNDGTLGSTTGAEGIDPVWSEEFNGYGNIQSSLVGGHSYSGEGSAAISLNGADNYVRVPTGNNLPLGNSPRTVMAWIKPHSYLDSAYNGIVAYGGGGCNGNTLLSIRDNGQLSMAFWCNDAYQYAGPSATLNEWNHVAFVYDGLDRVKFFMNGNYVDESVLALTPNTVNGSIRIGCTDDPGRCFDGEIDGVRIFDRNLLNSEIKGIYNNEYEKEIGLVGLWHFSEDIVINTVDSSSRKNDASLLGGLTTGTQGKFGNGLTFDGIDDYINIPDDNSLDITGNITISAWVKLDSTGNRWIVGKEPVNSSYELFTEGSQFVFRINDCPLGVCNSVYGGTQQVGVWTHVVGTFNGYILKLYVNGIEVASTPYNSSVLTTTSPLQIGAFANGTQYKMDGSIDEMRIYNRALSNTEVQDLFNANNGAITLLGLEEESPIRQKDFSFSTSVKGGAGYNSGEVGTVFEGAPPTIENLTVIDMDPCLYNNGYIFNWNYVPNTVPVIDQKSYQIIVQDTFDDHEVWNSGDPIIDYNPDLISAADSITHVFGVAEFGKTFKWKVKVWDHTDLLYSSWTSGPNFDTMLHTYPNPNFTYTPLNPGNEVVVSFSVDPDPGAALDRYGLYIYNWNFDDAVDSIVGNENLSSLQNPQHYFLAGSHAVGLTVTDGDSYSCDSSSNIIHIKTFPKWTEG